MITLSDLLQATGGSAHGPIAAREFAAFAYDSRLLRPGELFLAVKTERADGHDYIQDACRKGASGVLCEHPQPTPGVTCIVVADVRAALLDWARYILRRYAPDVIAVTGSVGKTTTKEAIAAVLGSRYPVFRNQGNRNDRYGLPIALGLLAPEQEKAVLEIACDHFDEIRELAELIHPRIGVVTTVSAAHLETLGSLENIAEEKGRLVEALPAEGLAVLNADDLRVAAMSARTRARVITYGVHSVDADLRAEDIRLDLGGLSFVCSSGVSRVRVHLPLLGRHNVYAALAALAVGLACDIPLAESAAALATLQSTPGRLNPLDGIGGSLILDDSYNASPAAMLAALDTLAELPAARRIAVLGDMLELGAQEEELHRQIGQRAACLVARQYGREGGTCGVDLLVTKGDRARWIAEAALAAGLPAEQVVVTYTAADALRAVRSYMSLNAPDGATTSLNAPDGATTSLNAPDGATTNLILVKGSAGARMEEVVVGLLARAEDRARLVRQGAAWEQVKLVQPGRPTWVEVDLEAIAHNVRRMIEIVGPQVDVMAVLKADAYGHGAVKVARTALNNGARMLGVACLGEAITLREAGITAPILALGYTPPWQAREAILHNVTVTCFSLDVARALSRAATDLRSEARVHVKVDTGMGRLGLLPEEAVPFIEQVKALPGLILEGLFTHFAQADAADKSYTLWQLARFQEVLDALAARGIAIPLIHAANSAATLTLPQSHFNLVRPGIALYGLAPSPETPCPPDFRPALSFKTMIAQVKTLPAGSLIGYGGAFKTERSSRIAVIPVGYADGFRRAPRTWGEVLVRGQRAPIVGRVCMDQTMIDVTDIPGVREGDEVVLIGQQGRERLSAEEVAERLGTINYEVISEILARVPRIS